MSLATHRGNPNTNDKFNLNYMNILVKIKALDLSFPYPLEDKNEICGGCSAI